MRYAALALVFAAPLALSARESPRCPAPASPGWQAVALPADVTRLHGWREGLVKALADARSAGHDGDVAREGVLLEPDAALDGAALPPGQYRCRTIKLGSQGSDAPAFIAYPSFNCRLTVEGARIGFAKTGGPQRPTGTIFPYTAQRQVFMGSLVLGDETRALNYGRDPGRDLAGTVERIGPQRWRLLLPYPRFDSLFDVIELVPVS